MPRLTKQQEKEYTDTLLGILSEDDTVYTILRHVSKSGMYRVIDMYVFHLHTDHTGTTKPVPLRISYSAGMLLEGYDDKHEGAKAGGAGMDMGFALVYNLAFRLFGDGYKLKQEWL